MVHGSLCCNWFSCHVWWDAVSVNWSNGSKTRDLRRVFQVKELPGVSSRSITVTLKPSSLTYTVASSFVGTSPLAVTTVVGLLPTLTVSYSAALVCPADHVHTCSGIYHKLSFLAFCCGCGRQHPLLGRRIECSSVLFLWACRYFLASLHASPRVFQCLQSSNFTA